jgi:TonB-linked SusC/RagA family outer membrane protein
MNWVCNYTIIIKVFEFMMKKVFNFMKLRLLQKKWIVVGCMLLGFGMQGMAQTVTGTQQTKGNTITGTILDEKNEPVPGATIIVKGTTRGVLTDMDGTFTIQATPEDQLEISSLGYQTLTVPVGKQTYINVALKPLENELDEVTIVAFGKQKKESVISAIQTVNIKDLKVPSSNLTTALGGRIAGMISYQTSGEPGYDNASFFIRGVTSFGTGKKDPLILVDNVEVTSDDLANLHPDDLQSFSILKDATATALYGARGANGVILITTQEGKEGAPKINVRIENSFSSPTSKIEMADPITYMRMANEAVSTRDPLRQSAYPQSQIDNTIRGTNPFVYPAVDWMGMLVKDYTSNQRANLNISGGGKVARYYVAGSLSQDNGILKVDNRNNFNNNINYKKYLLHSNININLSSVTEMIVRLHGTFNDYQGPIVGGSDLYKKILKVSPARFPAYYEPDEKFRDANHILFGRSMEGNFFNPYAEMLRGYKQSSNSTMMAQMELKHDFEKLIPGLTGRIMGNTSRYAAFDLSMAYKPFYYDATYDRLTNTYSLLELNPTEGTEYLNYSQGNKTVNYSLYGEGSLNYSKQFGEKHDVSGMLVGMIRNYLSANQKTLVASLPARNIGLAGRFTYGFDTRYFAEFNFGYNGSEKFDEGHRWGFFPSFGLGWNVSNEAFWENLREYISKLKIRGTYGMVGNDNIGSDETRFFYISEVIPDGGGEFRTGYELSSTLNRHKGYKIKTYPNPNVTWEISYDRNLGIELGLFKDRLNLQLDIFKKHRVNILQERADIPYEQGLWSTPLVNIGEADGQGVDLALDYQQTINKDIWFIARGNFTYARSTYAYYEEASWDLIEVPWKKHIGQPVSQRWGYQAERLFIDDNDVATSARQDFSRYEAGDIKYKDMNGDNAINELDEVPIGYPETPEINYGFGLSAGYKNVDFSFFFSGSARNTFFIKPSDMNPFIRYTDDGMEYEGGLAKFIADDHWTEQSQNPFATWPRLTDIELANNTQRSTWFMHNGNYLRLKSMELGYSLPATLTSKLKLSSFRIYVSGTNLLLFSKFKIWDVELGGNGLNYPLQRVLNIGINLSF